MMLTTLFQLQIVHELFSQSLLASVETSLATSAEDDVRNDAVKLPSTPVNEGSFRAVSEKSRLAALVPSDSEGRRPAPPTDLASGVGIKLQSGAQNFDIAENGTEHNAEDVCNFKNVFNAEDNKNDTPTKKQHKAKSTTSNSMPFGEVFFEICITRLQQLTFPLLSPPCGPPAASTVPRPAVRPTRVHSGVEEDVRHGAAAAEAGPASGDLGGGGLGVGLGGGQSEIGLA